MRYTVYPCTWTTTGGVAPGQASDLAAAALAVAGALGVVAVSVAPQSTTLPPEGAQPVDQLSYEYTPAALEAYFARRPVAVMQRAAQVAAEAAAFGFALATDIASGRVAENEGARAEQLRRSVERLGPAYVKVGSSTVVGDRCRRLTGKLSSGGVLRSCSSLALIARSPSRMHTTPSLLFPRAVSDRCSQRRYQRAAFLLPNTCPVAPARV